MTGRSTLDTWAFETKLFSLAERLFKVRSMSAARKFKRGKKSKLRTSLSLGERIDVIKQYDKTPSTRELAIMFKCSLTQIKNILRRKDEYLEEWENNGNLARIKRRQSARFLTVGVIICEWLYRSKRSGKIVDNNLILLTAKQVADKLNMAEVRPSNNWLDRMRQKFKMSDEELYDICMPRMGVYESLDIDDIIQDLRNSCPDKNVPEASLAFPYELTRFYLRETKDEAHDISKIRMKNCLEEAKSDKYLQLDGAGAWQPVKEEKEDPDYSDITINDGIVTVKTELMDYSSDSFQSGVTEHSIALLNEKQEMFPTFSNVCIKQEVLTKGIISYREAYNILGPMEHFALAQGDVKAMALINQLENVFREKMLSGKK